MEGEKSWLRASHLACLQEDRCAKNKREGFTLHNGCAILHGMEWSDLRYALELGRHGTLSAAGDAMGVARTTIGRRVRALEDALGVRLFDATPDGFIPTVEGQELIELAERMEAEVLVTRGQLLGRAAELSGRLRVSTLGFVYEAFVGVFESFTARYPNIELTVIATERELSLLRREADVVIRLGATPPERLIGRKLGVMTFAPYASKALVERVGEGACLADYPWISGDESSEVRWLDMWLEANAPGARVALRTEDYPVIHASVEAGMGVHLLPCFVADASPNLVRVGQKLDAEARPLWLLTLAELRSNRRVRAFMDHVAEAFSGVCLSGY